MNSSHTEVVCLNCKKSFLKENSQIKKHPRNFCSRSCAATHNNKKFPKRKLEGKCNKCKKPIAASKRLCHSCEKEIKEENLKNYSTKTIKNTKRISQNYFGPLSHPTKRKGDIGAMKAMTDLFEKGFQILIFSFSEFAPFDFVAYKNGNFYRIQAKYRKISKSGTLQIPFSGSSANSKGTYSIPVNKDEIDAYCVYCPDTDECYYFDPKKYNAAIELRINPPKQHNSRIHYAKDFKNPFF